MASRHSHQDIIRFEGKTLNRAQWAREFGASSEILCDFLDEHESNGLSRSEALGLFARQSTKPRMSEVIEACGQSLTRQEWIKALGLNKALFERILKAHADQGMSVSQALERHLGGVFTPIVKPTPRPKPRAVKPRKQNGTSLTAYGKTMSVRGWAKQIGCSTPNLRKCVKVRVERGMTRNEALEHILDGNSLLSPSIEVDGVSATRKEWAQMIGISYHAFCSKLISLKHSGLSQEEAVRIIASPPEPKVDALRNMIEVDGVSKTVEEWASHLGVKTQNLYSELSRGKRRGLSRADIIRKALKRNHERLAMIELDGETMTRQQWANRLGMVLSAFKAKMDIRLAHGVSESEALRNIVTGENIKKIARRPYKSARFIDYDGKSLTIDQWAGVLGKKSRTLRMSIRHRTLKGMTKLEALADIIRNGDGRFSKPHQKD